MRRKIVIVLAVILFLAGTTVYFYPRVENMIYDNNIARLQTQYFDHQDSDSENRFDALYEYMRSYNLELYENKQDKLIDPFSYSQPKFDLSEYGIDDNCIGFLIIEKIDVTLPVYLGANKENMQLGAVHLTETSFPIGGDNTNAVIAAHRGSRITMFRNIHKLQIGDTVIMQNFRETLVYQVSEIKIIAPTDVQELLIQDGRDLITLISCHPLGENYQRYVVYCERVTQSE